MVGDAGRHPEAARLYGVAESARRRSGDVRFAIYQSGFEESVAALRHAMGEEGFQAAWDAGLAQEAARRADATQAR